MRERKKNRFTVEEVNTGLLTVLMHLTTALVRKGVFTDDEIASLLHEAANASRSIDPNETNQAAGDFIEFALLPNRKRA